MYKLTYTYTMNTEAGGFTKGTLAHIEEQMDDDIMFLDFLQDLVGDAVELYNKRLKLYNDTCCSRLHDSGKNVVALSDLQDKQPSLN